MRLGPGPDRPPQGDVCVGGDVLLSTVSQLLLLLLLRDGIRVTRVTRHIGELSLVTVRVDISVLPSDDTVGSSSLLLEATVRRLVAEGEGPVIVQLVVVADGLHRRLLGGLWLEARVQPGLSRGTSVRVLPGDEDRCVVLGLLRVVLGLPGVLVHEGGHWADPHRATAGCCHQQGEIQELQQTQALSTSHD